MRRQSPIVAGTLSLILAAQPFASIAARAQDPLPPRPVKTSALTPDQRILHLLNRFTFGPTQVEIDAVRKMGVNAWFDEQSHPANIANAQLNSYLADYPAMALPADQLLGRFPSGNVIRQMAAGKLTMPDDPELAAIYRHRIEVQKENDAKKAESKQAKAETAPSPGAMQSGMAAMATAAQTAAEATAAAVPAAKPDAKKLDTASTRPNYKDLLDSAILNLPPGQRVHRILTMSPSMYEEFHSSLKGPERDQLLKGLTADQKELLASFDNPAKAVNDELVSQRLLRDIYSRRQLQEVMTTFWLNHFNIFLHKNEETPYYLASYERDVIRANALGSFEQLLVATAQSPAMMIYLDNSQSTGPDSPAAETHIQRQATGKEKKGALPGLNENYARELMELHTLGVNGGYTQKDVTEVARIFTGWTVDHTGLGGSFLFDATRHEPGEKHVLNHKFKEGGQKEGLKLLHMLATSPATAHFISSELAVAFVSDTPPESLVKRMAKTFESTQGDIPSVLRAMVHAPEFWSPESYQAKVKTPLEYVVSAVRASGAQIDNPLPLANQLNQMGMPLYACVPPTGYSAKADAWVSTGALVTRMNFSLGLAANRFNGVQTHWAESPPGDEIASAKVDSGPVVYIAPTNPIDPVSEEARLEARLLPTGASEKTRQAALDQLAVQAAQSNNAVTLAKPASAQLGNLEKQDAQLAGMLLGSPEFQRR